MIGKKKIRMQLYGSEEWKNLQTEPKKIIQGNTEVCVLRWVLGEIENI